MCFLIILFLIPISVKGDFGPKPSLNIKINYNTNNKIHVELLKKGNAEYEEEFDYTVLEKNFYDYLLGKSFDGYVSGQIYRPTPYRTVLDKKNDHFDVKFSYRYPKEFKLIVYDETNNKIFISKVIKQTAFDATMEVTLNDDGLKYLDITIVNTEVSISEKHNINKGIIGIFARIIITIIVEIFILFIFRYKTKKSYGIVTVTNLITQAILSSFLFSMIYLFGAFTYIFFFVIGEIIVILIELIVYKKLLNEKKDNRYIYYALLANFITLSLTFIPFLFN